MVVHSLNLKRTGTSISDFTASAPMRAGENSHSRRKEK